MPVVPLSKHQGTSQQQLVGETEFTTLDEPFEQVKIHIYLAAPIFIDQALEVSTRAAQVGACRLLAPGKVLSRDDDSL